MLDKGSNKLDDPISRRLRLFHRQHTIHTANKLVVERFLLALVETRQLHRAQRVDQLAVCRRRPLRLVEDRLDRFRGVGEHDARHCEWWWWLTLLAGLFVDALVVGRIATLFRLEEEADRRTEGAEMPADG
jgi:hypothetical protein